MILYAGNAEPLLGKRIDSHKRFFCYYPVTVIQFPDGRYGIRDSAGVCSPLPDNPDDFNVIYYEFVIEETLNEGKSTVDMQTDGMDGRKKPKPRDDIEL